MRRLHMDDRHRGSPYPGCTQFLLLCLRTMHCDMHNIRAICAATEDLHEPVTLVHASMIWPLVIFNAPFRLQRALDVPSNPFENLIHQDDRE